MHITWKFTEEKLSQKKVKPSAEMNVLPKSPPEAFPDEVLTTPTPEIAVAVFQEKEKPEELAVESDSESDDESTEVTNIQPNVNFLPATVEGLRKRFHELYTEFTRQGKHEHRNELALLSDELLRQQGIAREEYTILNNIVAKSLGSGIADGEEDDDDEESANVEGDSFEEDKTEDEKIKTSIYYRIFN